MMIQSEAAIDRTAARAQQDDEDSLFDSWLASLTTREFEFVLDRLAEPERAARQQASA